MKQQRIVFIGGGNMAEALISGLVKTGHDTAKITVTDPIESRLAELAECYGIQTSTHNVDAIENADAIVIAVKPKMVESVLTEIGSRIPEGATVVSIAAGIGIQKMKDSARRDQLALIRVMPNTPALLGAGMSVLFGKAEQQHKDRASYILSASGETAWVDEERLLHAATAVSGSGPAYFFLLAETLRAAGESLGLSKDLAAKLANQTALGSGKMLVESGRDAATLRAQVTSPGGTTQAALDAMYESDFPTAVRKGVQAASKRSKELS
ncbi:MAG: pyrroline-5-carboxylate reductase [Ghiorsea sp.]|nr:pyrroline-5-carboxylate reductase [Ghiorsea sp.]